MQKYTKSRFIENGYLSATKKQENTFIETHFHDFYELEFIVSGNGTYTVDGTEYEFDLGFDEAGGKLASVTCGGKNYDVDSFKNFYESMLVIEMVGEFKPDPSAELKEYLKIEIHSDVKSCEFVFYRIDSSRCYYTVDGVGGYYVLVSDVNVVRNNLQKYLNGEIVTR